MPRVFLDTNILAYDLDAGTPDKQRKVAGGPGQGRP